MTPSPDRGSWLAYNATSSPYPRMDRWENSLEGGGWEEGIQGRLTGRLPDTCEGKIYYYKQATR